MIKVYLNRKVSETQITIGNQYESGVNAIDFDLSELKQKWPNGNIYLLVSRKKHTWPYSIDDGEFKIEYVLTWKRGFYQMNVVVTDEKITDQLESSNTIFVSDTINAYVNENQINAKALNEQELPRELQIVYDDLITLKKNIEKDLADGKYIGPQGPKGEPGDVTEEYRNLASQIAQNASDAQASATNAQTSATNAQKAFDDTKAFVNQTKTELNQIKTDTSALKDEANTSAVNAQASATSAQESTTNASQSATSAQESATSAQESATNAQESATNAQTSATSAQKILDDTKGFVNQTKTELNQIKTDTELLKEEAKTSAVNAKASETKAKEYADNLQASTDDISQLKEDLVANEKEDAKTKRSLSALWDLNNGISYRFETDSEKAYQKQIPSGAKLGSVNKVGGKTIVMNQLIDPSRRDAKKIEFDELTKHFKYDNWIDIGSKYICSNINIIKGHKYYIYATDKVRYAITYFYGEGMKEILTKDTDAESVIQKILIATGSGINNLYFNRYTATSENVSYFDGCINLIDLTKMFGFGNEPSTPEEFEAMFPNDYYAYNEGELMSMGVNDVVYTDTSSNQNSHQISQSIQNIDGYGWSAGTAYNYVDFENKKFHKCVDRVDLGTFDEIYLYSGVTPEEGRYVYAINISAIKTKSYNNAICELFDSVSFDELISKDGMYLNSAYNQLLVSTSKYKSVKELRSYINGKYLYYELAEPIVTDISELIGDTFQEPLEVESGGSLTFKNTNGDDYQIAVPSDIQYTVALSEVNA